MPTLCLSPCRALSTPFIANHRILLEPRYSVVRHASGHLFLFRPFSKINKMAIIIPILQMRRLTCPVSPSQSWWDWNLGPGLTLLYIPRTHAMRGTLYYTPSPQSTTCTGSAQSTCVDKDNGDQDNGEVGASADKGVESEDLEVQRGDPKETPSKTPGRELFAFSRSRLAHWSSRPWRG